MIRNLTRQEYEHFGKVHRRCLACAGDAGLEVRIERATIIQICMMCGLEMKFSALVVFQDMVCLDCNAKAGEHFPSCSRMKSCREMSEALDGPKPVRFGK